LSGTKIAAVFMRGGTSKGLFFHERDLPADTTLRDQFLLTAMGSPDVYGLQLNGMGGGVSSLSKIIVVRPSDSPAADVDYLHGQVTVERSVIDYSANCGNLSGAVGPFAIAEALVAATEGETLVRLRNLNTGDIIHARVPVARGKPLNAGDFRFPGVGGVCGAKITLDYIRPGDGTLFPTGLLRETLEVDGTAVEVTLGLAPLPTVWLRAGDLGLSGCETPDEINDDKQLMARLDAIRRHGAVRMGLAATAQAAPEASPKIGVLAPAVGYAARDGSAVGTQDIDLVARVISMGAIHKALPLACAMNLAAIALVEGSLPHALAGGASGRVRLGSPSGVITLSARIEGGPPAPTVASIGVETTARRLMEGFVYGD